MPASVVPRYVLNVEDLEEFESHEVVVRVLVLLGDGVGKEGLDLLLKRCLLRRLTSSYCGLLLLLLMACLFTASHCA